MIKSLNVFKSEHELHIFLHKDHNNTDYLEFKLVFSKGKLGGYLWFEKYANETILLTNICINNKSFSDTKRKQIVSTCANAITDFLNNNPNLIKELNREKLQSEYKKYKEELQKLAEQRQAILDKLLAIEFEDDFYDPI